ncbi:cytochrome c oxidase assembly factor 3, mitochondrial [Octopus bimaculoides]|uniref:Cytochrome c oxidase assembly factor 3 n=1 Tax=Octopus bimaculoides TaxID=37653 RepID=A0A0L8G261_OCTBM|nr:cytochrome c oxidase assembly factor 3, mitochondrial [Octopus bimaculoides]|eukprot:XP_014784781.1 PREDICTED: cytochrome c oxidase assembly factor 3, mitochondrial-like [Octopus bimaculoides]
MAENRQMPKVDMQKEFAGLSESQKYFVRKLESINKERAQNIKSLKRRNLMTGFLIGGCVLAIYIYSMTAVRQEKFLDEFDALPNSQKKESAS